MVGVLEFRPMPCERFLLLAAGDLLILELDRTAGDPGAAAHQIEHIAEPVPFGPMMTRNSP